MPEIHVVQRGNRHLYESYFDPYFRLRHDIYVKRRKWMALDRPDGREIDQFDTEDAVYLFCLDGGQLIGAMRAVPTLSPTLMSDIFPYLSIRGPIRRADVYELSRIFVIPERRGEHAGPRVEMLLLTAIMEYGISIGLTGFSIVLESWWLPRFERCGWRAHPLGLPQMIDGMSVLAVLVDCDETTWKSLCGQIGLTNPTLTWQGLTGRQSPDSEGHLSSSFASRSASAMSSSRCRLSRSLRTFLIKRRPKAVVSSAFNASSLDCIWMGSIADIPD